MELVLRLLGRDSLGLALGGQGSDRGGLFLDCLLAGIELGLYAFELGHEGGHLRFGLLLRFQGLFLFLAHLPVCLGWGELVVRSLVSEEKLTSFASRIALWASASWASSCAFKFCMI